MGRPLKRRVKASNPVYISDTENPKAPGNFERRGDGLLGPWWLVGYRFPDGTEISKTVVFGLGVLINIDDVRREVADAAFAYANTTKEPK